MKIDNYVSKIDKSINEFRFNVSIAYFYEVYKIFREFIEKEISKNILKENIIKIMKLLIPFTPHLAYECLELHNCKSTDTWPKVLNNILNEINLAIQINGKTRDVIKIQKDMLEKDVDKIVKTNLKTKKYIEKGVISKTIFVKNKIINYIVK